MVVFQKAGIFKVNYLFFPNHNDDVVILYLRSCDIFCPLVPKKYQQLLNTYKIKGAYFDESSLKVFSNNAYNTSLATDDPMTSGDCCLSLL